MAPGLFESIKKLDKYVDLLQVLGLPARQTVFVDDDQFSRISQYWGLAQASVKYSEVEMFCLPCMKLHYRNFCFCIVNVDTTNIEVVKKHITEFYDTTGK
jgi:hypothetical protein